MVRGLPIFAALTLITLSRSTLAIDPGSKDSVQVETRKIPFGGDLSRPMSTQPIAPQPTGASVRSTRVLIIIAKDCEDCSKELARLRKSGGEFDVMKSLGWKIGEEPSNHVQIVDRDEVPEMV